VLHRTVVERGTARHSSLAPHLSVEELERRYRVTQDLVERSRWHFLWLLARGLTAKVIASITGYHCQRFVWSAAAHKARHLLPDASLTV
jgi:hypothetical protein